ncbi:thioesterase family protein [Burkholderia sp. Ax-1719]|uniref:acyl-CoA thioesterase n=1 Tax=Burkholderia sp. Ax-1719 TaxID=2608334 RepID=UPI001F03CF45|nr:thioesterase family protein [Burkholderia sp. Ax-1719]NIE63087.1 acyl-CoA thioesterase [Burkholderia sp. Ax-1719]
MKDLRRKDFAHFTTIQTRWKDNDIYGHVNNVNYYSFFDTAVNRILIEEGVLDIHEGEVVGFVVDSGCSYFKPVSFPDTLEVGTKVSTIGRTSVRYELAIFKTGEDTPAAAGHFVHVYVDRRTGKSTEIPETTRRLLEALIVQYSASVPA